MNMQTSLSEKPWTMFCYHFEMPNRKRRLELLLKGCREVFRQEFPEEFRDKIENEESMADPLVATG